MCTLSVEAKNESPLELKLQVIVTFCEGPGKGTEPRSSGRAANISFQPHPTGISSESWQGF